MAQALFHTATYEMDGKIDFKKQAGHFCNTGAEIKQTIMGSGVMDKVQTITQKKGIITMDDTNDWVAGDTPLTVTTVWKLCTPPKYTYDTVNFLGDDVTVPVALTSLYYPGYGPDGNMPASLDMLGGAFPFASGITVEQAADFWGWDALTEQYWAVQVEADPGFSGNIHQKGEAAYGGFWGDGVFDYDAGWKRDLVNYNDHWRWEVNKDGNVVGPVVGSKFVGDYFNMEQMARTSMGTLKRHIDISSPWSHGYLYEDMSVVGKSQITEAIKLGNLPAGKDVPKDWWLLF
jgi:hypothetical protein